MVCAWIFPVRGLRLAAKRRISKERACSRVGVILGFVARMTLMERGPREAKGIAGHGWWVVLEDVGSEEVPRPLGSAARGRESWWTTERMG